MINKNLVKNKNHGYILIQVIVFASISAYILGALINWAAVDIKASRQAADRELAIQIAEAGIDYYRWHLAHAPTDYYDGTGQVSTYIHDFLDKNNTVIGQFALDITAPQLGSSLVTIKSTGSVLNTPNLTRTIQVKLAKPSMAKFAVVANDYMRFGEGTEVFGPVHSNKGIRFDGLAHNIVSSSATTTDDPDHTGAEELAVHTHILPVDPLPPNELPDRPDVFEAGRTIGVGEADFDGITGDISQIKVQAQGTDGFWRAGSGALGYHVVLKTNDTFDLKKVDTITTVSSCEDKWSIGTETLLGNYPFPANGIIFLEDHAWVDGKIDGAQLTIVAAALPENASTLKNIIINNDLLYTKYDGSDVLGLIAQNNVWVGLVSEDDLRIDGALMAQKGKVARVSYSQTCSPTYHDRQTLTLWGMIASNSRYGFAWINTSTGEHMSGYLNRILYYDSSLLYNPPPSFPLTSDQYITLSWEEIK